MREERNPYFNRKLKRERERAKSMLFIRVHLSSSPRFCTNKRSKLRFSLRLLMCLVAKKVREKKISVFILFMLLGFF